jgi:D-alanine-D-alanine ligase-like ATP-grasp enzyme
MAGELGIECISFQAGQIRKLPAGPLLLRLSDPVMLDVTRMLTAASIPYLGPGEAALQRCYDKLAANRIVSGAGIDCPASGPTSFPRVIKPRRGSDSIGVRVLHHGPVPARYSGDQYLNQEYVRGAELTVAVLHGRAGMPLKIDLPEGTPYSFLRKYLLRPSRAPLADAALAERVRMRALRIAGLLGVDWAARIDFIHEPRSGQLYFLECDAAPLIGPGSAFADSLLAAGMRRDEQLALLLKKL